MSIRFKFRSCKNFESLDIDGRASISLRELRLMIARQKKLNLDTDFDLIFFNADSGQEYNDENLQIESGSSVILKRVPAGTMPSTVNNRPPIGTMKDLGLKDVDRINHVDGQVNEFHDFGADICPVAAGIFPNIDVGHQNCWDFEKEKLSGPRFQYQKLDSRGLNQAIQRGSNHSKIPTKLPEPKTPDAPTLHKVIHSNFPAVPNNALLVELKCSLCNTFFKNAVMIPCCQNSFCEKCIRLALLGKAMCPKCSSSIYRVDDLLPNLSLRKAIEHFLVSQMIAIESENALRRYVPDAESGNQKDIPGAVTVVQREPEMPHSPSASGKGSNQVMAEPFYDSLVNEKSLSRTMQQIDGGRGRYANHWNFLSVPDDPEGCRGESKPNNFLHSHVQDEVDASNKKNTGLWCDTRGGNMNFLPAGRVKKVRNCYLCGSPDHLIKECAFASNQNPMLQTGNLMPMGGISAYSSSFWINNPYSTPRPFANSTLRPFANMYGNAPFYASMVPQTPMPPPHMRSMHVGMPLHGEIMRIGGMALPAGKKDDLPFNHYEYMSLQLSEDKRRIQNDKMGRGQYFQADSNFKEHFPKNARKTHIKHLHVSDRKCGVNFHERGSQLKDHPSSALERSSPVHQKARSKEKRGFGHDAKHSRHHARHSTKVRDNKKQMSSDSSEDCRDGYHRKRKRDH